MTFSQVFFCRIVSEREECLYSPFRFLKLRMSLTFLTYRELEKKRMSLQLNRWWSYHALYVKLFLFSVSDWPDIDWRCSCCLFDACRERNLFGSSCYFRRFASDPGNATGELPEGIWMSFTSEIVSWHLFMVRQNPFRLSYHMLLGY